MPKLIFKCCLSFYVEKTVGYVAVAKLCYINRNVVTRFFGALIYAMCKSSALWYSFIYSLLEYSHLAYSHLDNAWAYTRYQSRCMFKSA